MAEARLTTITFTTNGGLGNAAGVVAGDRIVNVLDTSDWSDQTSLFAEVAPTSGKLLQTGTYGGTPGNTGVVLLARA